MTLPADLDRAASHPRRGSARASGSAMTRIRSARATPLALGGIEIAGRAAPPRPLGRRRRPPRHRRRAPRRGRRSATSAGCSRPTRGRRAGSPARELARRASSARSPTRAGGRRAVDVTIVGARPRLGRPCSTRCATAIAELLGLDVGAVNVKASTGNLGGADAGAASRPISVATVADGSGARDDAPPPGHAHRRDPAARAARAGPRPDLQLRPDGLRPDPHRQLPVVPVRRRPRPLPALPRAAGDLGHEHHRHRRQDHPRRGRRRRSPSAS